MEAINYTEMVNNWPTMMVKVTANHVPLIITSEYCQPVVMMSLEDFNAWQETAYLTRSPANAKDLMSAMQELKARVGWGSVYLPTNSLSNGGQR